MRSETQTAPTYGYTAHLPAESFADARSRIADALKQQGLLAWFNARLHSASVELPALSGGLVGGIPLEKLLFGFSFGWYWTGVYEHFTWSTSVTRVKARQVTTGP